MSTVHFMLIAMLALRQEAQPTFFLDLTTPEVKEMDKSKTVGCHSGRGVYVTGGRLRPPRLTLGFDIEQVNRDRFRLGDVVVADMLITNTGNKPVLLPWNPDRDIVYGKDCNGLGLAGPPATLEGSMALKLVDSEGRGKWVGAHFLYARRDQPTSYRVLPPQQSARVRVDGRLTPPLPATGIPPAPGPLRFKLIASFDLADSTLPNAYVTVVSENQKEVIVAGR